MTSEPEPGAGDDLDDLSAVGARFTSGQPDSGRPDSEQPHSGPPDNAEAEGSPAAVPPSAPDDDALPEHTSSTRFVARAGRLLAVVLVLALLVPTGRWLADEFAFGASRDAVEEELGADAQLIASMLLVRAAGCDGRVSTGSGFVVEVDGVPSVITNRHVVDDSRVVSVRPLDGSRVVEVASVRVAGGADVAVLELDDPSALGPALPIGRDVGTGDEVRVVGFPSGRPSTGAGEVVDHDAGRLLVDAPVSSGASGSPLLDPDGRVVGQVYATTLDGLGVATPVSVVVAAAAGASAAEGCVPAGG